MDLKPRSAAAAIKNAFARYLSLNAWRCALLGVQVAGKDPQVPRAARPQDYRKLLKDIRQLLVEERDRGAEVRRRSEQSLGRIMTTVPFVAGVIGLSASRGWITPLLVGIASALALLIAAIAVHNNLGKETYYVPIWLPDLLKTDGKGNLEPPGLDWLVAEHAKALQDNSLRHSDEVDRRLFAHGIFVLGLMLLVVSAGGLTYYLTIERKRPEEIKCRVEGNVAQPPAAPSAPPISAPTAPSGTTAPPSSSPAAPKKTRPVAAQQPPRGTRTRTDGETHAQPPTRPAAALPCPSPTEPVGDPP